MNEVIQWLMSGDASIAFQTKRDLLGIQDDTLQERILSEGWGKRFLSCQLPNGHWGRDFYQPKWMSTHYTLLDLCLLNTPANCAPAIEIVSRIATENKGEDGGINPGKTISHSDLCVNGMYMNYATWFRLDESLFHSIVDFVLTQQLPDGGFNCRFNRNPKGKIRHSSMHSTISMIEGINQYEKQAYSYRLEELLKVRQQSVEFLLQHHLFRSDHTHEIIHPEFLKFRFPARWYYNILRALDAFRYAGIQYDLRMQEALSFVAAKKNKNGRWKQVAKVPGQVHFDMEVAGKSGRWNTLIAMRVLQFYSKHDQHAEQITLSE